MALQSGEELSVPIPPVPLQRKNRLAGMSESDSVGKKARIQKWEEKKVSAFHHILGESRQRARNSQG